MTAIYTNESNPHALKLLVGANFSKSNLDLKIVNLNDRTLQEPRHLPYLEVDSENSIFISNAALNFLVPPTQDDVNERKINELLELESIMLSPSLAMAIGSATNKNDRIFSGIVSYLEKLNKVLESKPNLVDDGISTGDIAIWSTLYPLSKDDSLSKEYLSNFANLSQWLKKLADIPEFKDAINKFPIQSGAASYQALYNGAKYLSATNMVAAPSGDSSHKSQHSSPQHQAEKSELITPQELIDAEKAWKRDPKEIPKLKPHQKVVLPTPGEKNILITSALPYVNNVPHLGNIIGCVLSADVFARFARLCNWNTAYIGGTDEYGTATETKALEMGLTCRQICDKYYAVHNDIYKWFNISFDYFGRTSDPEQTELCQDMFLQLNSNGFMFIDSVEQLHCERCDRYLADRFVEGGCPHVGCNYEDARGDQCDGCGKLVNAVDLKNPRCKICSSSPKLKISKQFFMDLPKLEPLILHWIKKSSGGWSHNAQVIAKSWLKEGLKPRCITRDLKWGVPVPLEEFKNKVFYVWFDAPIGYMSISKAYTEEWERWWRPQNGTEVTLYQFMAKDNVPFHSVMFPATLLGANRGYITVSHIMATEYLNYEDGKFSKSRGVGVFGNDARDTGIPSDVWRFYLLYLRPESQDSSFSWADLATKNNSELLNNLGNFINRALVFAKNNFNRTVPAMKLTQDDYSFLVLCTRELRGYVTCLEKCKLRDGIRHILSISRHGNQYMQSNQPWVLLKGTDEEKLRAGTVIGVCCNIACLLSALLNPYLPETSAVLKKQLNAPDAALNPENPDIAQLLPSGHKLGEPSPLFAKLEQSRVEELKQRFAGKQGENNNTNTAAPNNTKKPNKHAVTNNSIPIANDVTKVDVESIESEVCKQADKVRALKSSGVEKKMWQPEVDVLLALKKKLEAAQKLVQNKVDTSKPTSNGLANGNSVPVAAGDDVETLEEAVSRQGLVVRKLKEGGADKSVWQPEVTKLLELKARLAKISGKPQAEPQKNKKSSKKIGA